jgi:arylsulfatase A-like enzyme
VHSYAPHDPYGERAHRDVTRPGPPTAATVERARRLHAKSREEILDLPADEVRDIVVDFVTDGRSRIAYLGPLGPRGQAFWDRTDRWLDEDHRRDPDRAEVDRRLLEAYRDGLGYADAIFDHVRTALRRAGVDDRSVVCVVSDHGEAFGEHGTLLHGRWLYDELLRVPLVVHAPGRLEPKAVRGSCGLVDVLPTLLELAGVPVPDGLDGRSLLPLARGEVGGHPVVAQERRGRVASDGQTSLLCLTSVRTERAKWIRTADPATGEERIELYDLAASPDESRPLDLERLKELPEPFRAIVSRIRFGADRVERFGACP